MWVHDDPMTQIRGIAAVKVYRRACTARRRDPERRDGPSSVAADENSQSDSHLRLSTGDRRFNDTIAVSARKTRRVPACEDAGRRRALHFPARSPCGFQSTLNNRPILRKPVRFALKTSSPARERSCASRSLQTDSRKRARFKRGCERKCSFWNVIASMKIVIHENAMRF